MGFPILVRWHLYIESGPRWSYDYSGVYEPILKDVGKMRIFLGKYCTSFVHKYSKCTTQLFRCRLLTDLSFCIFHCNFMHLNATPRFSTAKSSRIEKWVDTTQQAWWYMGRQMEGQVLRQWYDTDSKDHTKGHLSHWQTQQALPTSVQLNFTLFFLWQKSKHKH